MLVVISLGWAALQAGRYALPPLLPRITETLHLSSGTVGLALTGFGLAYAVVQYPSGSFSDALSRATLLVPAFVVLFAGFVLICAATTPVLFVAGLLVIGAGKGLYASPSRALVADLFPSGRGRALGLYTAGTDVGGLVASGLAVVVLAWATWQVAFLPVVVVLVLVGALFVVWNREAYRIERVAVAPGATFRRIVATRRQREMLVAYSVFYFVVGGLTNFLPLLLVEHGGFSEAVAGGIFALVFAVGMVTKPATGALSDRFPRLLVSVLGLLVAAAGLAVMLLGSTLPVVVAGTVLLAVGFKAQFPISDAVIMEAAPEGNVGGDLGAARGAFLAANAAGPGFVGVVADIATYGVAFWALAACFLVSAAVLTAQYWRERPN